MQVQTNQHEAGREKQLQSDSVQSANYLLVRQPQKSKGMQELLNVLTDLERISEFVSEDRSSDLGSGAQAGSAATVGAGSAQVTVRDQAIQSLPPVPIMRKKLTAHLQKEIRQLERSAKKLVRSARKGGAYLLNETYARIRKIEKLIAEILQAAADVVRRLYVRLFVDHQQLV